MTDADQLGELRKTDDGSHTLRNPEIDEEYHSSLGAKFESYHLYILESGFLDSLNNSDKVAVLDVGLGLAYNALTTIETWLANPKSGELSMVSLEKNSKLVEALCGGKAAWCESWSQDWLSWSKSLEPMATGYQMNLSHANGARLHWQVLIGDGAKLSLPNLSFQYIWQDAFSPKKNPEMWTEDWMAKVAAVASPDCCLVTYSVARMVRDSLVSAGWHIEKLPAPGNKRNWLKAILVNPASVDK